VLGVIMGASPPATEGKLGQVSQPMGWSLASIAVVIIVGTMWARYWSSHGREPDPRYAEFWSASRTIPAATLALPVGVWFVGGGLLNHNPGLAAFGSMLFTVTAMSVPPVRAQQRGNPK
jgi:hypothetical protein